MKQCYINNVYLASIVPSEFTPTSRFGTGFISLNGFAAKFGNPHEQDWSEDGLDEARKVHAIWHIQTPRGIAQIRDYWWNPSNQLSIACQNKTVLLWVKGWLKCHDVKCETGMGN